MQVIRVFLQAGFSLYIRNRYRYRLLLKELDHALQPYNAALDHALKKRIWFYTLQSSLTNQWFTTLRGASPTTKEIKAGLYLGAYTPIYDDLMDETQKTHAALTAQHDDALPLLSLMHFLQQKIDENILQHDQYRQTFQLLGVAQNNSLRQMQQQRLTPPELQNITDEKGGYATLLYRCILDHPFKPNEEKAICRLGGTLQLINDVFDIYKDLQNGSKTLITTSDDMHITAKNFDESVQQVFSLFQQLDYPRKNIQQMLLQVSTILSRGKVCFEQLEQLQNNHRHFDPQHFSRQQLICDMEKWKNIRRSISICKEWEKKW